MFKYKTLSKNIIIFIFLGFTYCSAQLIDEKYAVEVARTYLSLPQDISVKAIKGGHHKPHVFVISSEKQRYVVFFFNANTSQADMNVEIYNLSVTANAGFGPQLYFADSSQGIMIMEFLPGQSIPWMDTFKYLSTDSLADCGLQSEKTYNLLVQLLKKIHNSRNPFKGDFSQFKRIDDMLTTYKTKLTEYVPINKFITMIEVLHWVLDTNLVTNVPCHMDLHRENFLVSELDVKAIDLDRAGQADPYFDIGAVVVSLFLKHEHEVMFLKKYLGREPKKKELAKLYLMKQIMLISWFLHGFLSTPTEKLNEYAKTQALSFADLAAKFVSGELSFEGYNDVHLLKAIEKQIIDNFESKQFKDAVAAFCAS